jgi:hypothetical protein
MENMDKASFIIGLAVGLILGTLLGLVLEAATLII